MAYLISSGRPECPFQTIDTFRPVTVVLDASARYYKLPRGQRDPYSFKSHSGTSEIRVALGDVPSYKRTVSRKCSTT